MEKLLLLHAAAQLTTAACSSLGSSSAVDPNLEGADGKAKRLQVWETFRAYYHGLVNVMASREWPAPASSDPGAIAGGVGAGLSGLLKDPTIAGLINQLLAAIPKPPAVSGPITPAPELVTPPPAKA